MSKRHMYKKMAIWFMSLAIGHKVNVKHIGRWMEKGLLLAIVVKGGIGSAISQKNTRIIGDK